MADPRDTLSHEGVDGVYETFKIDNSTITFDKTKPGGSAQVGLAVTFSADDTAKLTEDGEYVLGKLIEVEIDNKATIQTGGGMSLAGGASASLTVGKQIVGALGASSAKGYIREVATGTAAELGVARGRINNNDVTTAVSVTL